MQNKFFTDIRYAISWGIISLIAVAIFSSIFLIANTFAVLDNQPYPNSITIQGEGEVFAVPDIATFSFTVSESEKDAKTAQNKAAEKVNAAIDFLQSEGIEERDIRTTEYNSYPKYEYMSGPCTDFVCPPGRNELVGYEVRQTVSVKVRQTDQTGELLSGVGDIGITNMSGISFTVDDITVLQDEARNLAIADAKDRAEKLAAKLGVDLDDVMSFAEDSGPYYGGYGMGGDLARSMEMSSSIPEIPVGENKITARVYVTFEID